MMFVRSFATTGSRSFVVLYRLLFCKKRSYWYGDIRWLASATHHVGAAVFLSSSYDGLASFCVVVCHSKHRSNVLVHPIVMDNNTDYTK
mmetsp:Transcript_35262/g.40510  ORF Transcript_35262/g.40510 Transcript_35262/m.40510 type:complete len:89 (+) Transcript_35262:213-479(+)